MSENKAPEPPAEEPKRPLPREPENGFLKEPAAEEPPVAAALRELKDDLKDAPLSPRTKWFITAVITLAGSLAYPCGTGVSSYTEKRAEMEERRKTKAAEALNQQRKMQADLLKRIIAVAEKATLKNPNSVFQLGLIAQMVNENRSAFGIRLEEAEQTMKRMSDRLAPISGLRTRLAESEALIASMGKQYVDARKHEKELTGQLIELRSELKKTKLGARWLRGQLQKKVDEKEQELVGHRIKRRFYEERLKREEHFRSYFQRQLDQQSKLLQQALKDVSTARDQAKQKSLEVEQLAEKLQRESRAAKGLAEKLRQKLKVITDDYDQSKQSIERLRSELTSERRELRQLRLVHTRLLQLYREQCTAKPTAAIRPRSTRRVRPAAAARVSVPQPKAMGMPPGMPAMRPMRFMVDGLFKD